MVLVNHQNLTIYGRDKYPLGYKGYRGYSGFVPARLGRLSLGADKLTASGQHFGDTTCTVASNDNSAIERNLSPNNTRRASPCLLIIPLFASNLRYSFSHAHARPVVLAAPRSVDPHHQQAVNFVCEAQAYPYKASDCRMATEASEKNIVDAPAIAEPETVRHLLDSRQTSEC